MKIPGLTFIIVPILIYLLYLYIPDIVCFFEEITFRTFCDFIFVLTIVNVFVIIILGMCNVEDGDATILVSNYLLIWLVLKLIWKVLSYINNKLTVTL